MIRLLAIAGATLALIPAQVKAHVHGCHSKACDKRIHLKRRAHWKRVHIWQWRFAHLSPAGRYWAHCVSSHESGNRRVARESGFLSYFQWTEQTWLNAGGHGNPENVSWAEQAVRAWRWHSSHPTGQWPNTGEGGRCGS